MFPQGKNFKICKLQLYCIIPSGHLFAFKIYILVLPIMQSYLTIILETHTKPIMGKWGPFNPRGLSKPSFPMILGMCVQSSCKYLQWIYASFQAWRDVLPLFLLFLYLDLIDTWSVLVEYQLQLPTNISKGSGHSIMVPFKIIIIVWTLTFICLRHDQ